MKGVVKIAPSLNWLNFPLFEKLEPFFEIPVIIENDVNLAALGENWFGIGEGVNNLVMISIGTGIGSGIILDGKLHRGYRDSSGEIGYLLPGLNISIINIPVLVHLRVWLPVKELRKKPFNILRNLLLLLIYRRLMPLWFLMLLVKAKNGQ